MKVTQETGDRVGGPVGERSAIRVVLRAPQVVRVLAASLVGRIPLGAAPLAILLFAGATMPISRAGLLVGAYTAGMAVGQPVLARAADRWRQPPVMWAAVVLSTAGFLVVAAGVDFWPALVGAVAAGFGAPPFEAGLRVLWRDLVDQRHLHAAYTMDVTAQELIFIVGPVVTVAVIALVGPAGGLLAAAVAQLGGTLVFATAPAVRRWRGVVAARHWAGPLASAPLRVLLVATVLLSAGVGATTVAVTAFAEAEGAPSWAGWLLAAQGAGALLGGLLSARRPPVDPAAGLPVATLLLAVGYLPPLLTGPLPVMLVLLAISGMMLPAVLTAVFLTTDRVAPAGTAAESFAWVATAFAIGSALGAAGNGFLVDAFARDVLWFVAAPTTIAVSSVILWLARPARLRPAGG